MSDDNIMPIYVIDSAKKIVRATMKRTGTDTSGPALGWPYSK